MRVLICCLYGFDGLNKDGVAVDFNNDHDVLHFTLRRYAKTSDLICVDCSF